MNEGEKLKEYIKLLDLAFPKPPKDVTNSLFMFIQNYKIDILYEFNGDKIIGGVVVVDKNPLFGVELMAIHPKYQGYGYGKSLMLKVEKKHKGILILSTKRSEEFYQKIGYTTLKKIDDRSYMFKINDYNKMLPKKG